MLAPELLLLPARMAGQGILIRRSRPNGGDDGWPSESGAPACDILILTLTIPAARLAPS
jgi:hypothetical protein